MVTETATGRGQQPGLLTASCSRAIGTHYYYHRLQYRRIYLNNRTYHICANVEWISGRHLRPPLALLCPQFTAATLGISTVQ